MAVNVAQGDPLEVVIPSGTLVGGSLTTIFTKLLSTWQALAHARLQITTTATAGGRTFAFRFTDAQSNIVFETNGGGQAASTTQRYVLGVGTPNLTIGGVVYVPLPRFLFLPPGLLTISAIDFSGTDVNDALSAPAPFVFTA